MRIYEAHIFTWRSDRGTLIIAAPNKTVAGKLVKEYMKDAVDEFYSSNIVLAWDNPKVVNSTVIVVTNT